MSTKGIKHLADEIERAFGPLEWFKVYPDGNGEVSLVVTTHWPSFDREATERLAKDLNEILKPHVLEARERLLAHLAEKAK